MSEPENNETNTETSVTITEDTPGFDVLDDADTDNQVKQEKSRHYQVLARKYRPRDFTDLIGQEAMVQTLTNAFETGRIAHAFMLTGVRGVGKTTTARILARALNYQNANQDTPSMQLNEAGVHCDEIMDGAHVDVIEMDAASRTGINDVREIIENVRYLPAAARYKVYIIDEVHMLSKAAFNGLLKTLEEPPPHVKFIFATTEIRQVPVTVLSRCQRFDLRRLSQDDTLALLNKVCAAEAVSLPEEALSLIARAADGSARDGLSLLDRALAHIDPETGSANALDGDTMRALLGLANRERVFDLFDKLMAGALPDALDEFDAQYAMGVDPVVILADLAELTHWLTRLKYVTAARQDVTFSAALRERGQQAADQLSARILVRAWQVLLQGHDEAQRAMNARAAAEMVLIRLAHLADSPTPEELLKQWDAPTDENKGEATPAPAAPPQANVTSALPSQTNAAPAPQQAQESKAVMVPNFQAVLNLAAQHGEASLKRALENYVHLVDFAPAHGSHVGRIEMRLAGGHDQIPQQLTRKLREWTGQQWVVSLNQEKKGAPSWAEQYPSDRARHYKQALDDPFVKAALASFPKAEIISIRESHNGFDAGIDSGSADDAPVENENPAASAE